MSEDLSNLGLDPERLYWGAMTLAPNRFSTLLEELERRPPKTILEVGAGTSSAILGAIAHRNGAQFISLENYQPTIDYVDFLTKNLPCSSAITIQKCGFRRYTHSSGHKFRWFNANLDAFENPIEFVLVDGPMSSLVGRDGALFQIAPYLAPDFRLYLDDAIRPHEASCVATWMSTYENLTARRKSGMCELRPEPPNG